MLREQSVAKLLPRSDTGTTNILIRHYGKKLRYHHKIFFYSTHQWRLLFLSPTRQIQVHHANVFFSTSALALHASVLPQWPIWSKIEVLYSNAISFLTRQSRISSSHCIQLSNCPIEYVLNGAWSWMRYLYETTPLQKSKYANHSKALCNSRLETVTSLPVVLFRIL